MKNTTGERPFKSENQETLIVRVSLHLKDNLTLTFSVIAWLYTSPFRFQAHFHMEWKCA